MKLSCQIVRDLLPLYVDGACSGESRVAVEEHLAACEDCMQEAEAMRAAVALPPAEEEAVRRMTGKKAFRRVRRRVIALVLAVLLMIPLGTLGVHQITGTGICYTNLTAIASARSLLNDLRSGDYAAAAERLASKDGYESYLCTDSYYGVSREYTRFKVAGTDYYVDRTLAEDLNAEGELSEAGFWLAVLQSGEAYLMPEEAYALLEAEYPEELAQAERTQELGKLWSEEGVRYYYPKAGFAYDVHASFGNGNMEDFFYVAQNSCVLSSDLYAYVRSGTAREAKWYGLVSSAYQALGYEGYASAWRDQAAERLTAMEQAGRSLSSFRLSQVFRWGGGWVMCWLCQLQDGSQEELRLLMVDGQLQWAGGQDGALSAALDLHLDDLSF